MFAILFVVVHHCPCLRGRQFFNVAMKPLFPKASTLLGKVQHLGSGMRGLFLYWLAPCSRSAPGCQDRPSDTFMRDAWGSGKVQKKPRLSVNWWTELGEQYGVMEDSWTIDRRHGGPFRACAMQVAPRIADETAHASLHSWNRASASPQEPATFKCSFALDA